MDVVTHVELGVVGAVIADVTNYVHSHSIVKVNILRRKQKNATLDE